MIIHDDKKDRGVAEIRLLSRISQCHWSMLVITFGLILSICINCRVSSGAGGRSVSTKAPVMPVVDAKREAKKQVAKMVMEEGKYEAAIERVCRQFGRPHWKRAGRLITDIRDYMYALRMMSQLMVYVDKKKVFDMYMPKLLRGRERILDYEYNPKTAFITAQALKKIRESKKYSDALERYRYPQKAYEATSVDMKRLIKVPQNIDKQLADIFFDEIASFESTEAAVKTARAVIDAMKKYRGLPEKYKYAFTRGELIKRWLENYGDDLRARNLALHVWARAENEAYIPRKQINKSMQQKFDELWRAITRARIAPPWRDYEERLERRKKERMRPASPQVKRRLKKLLGRVSNAFERSDADSVKALLHPQAMHRKRGLKGLGEADISTYKYMNFNKFHVS